MTDTQMFILIFTGVWSLVGVIFLAVGLGLRAAFRRREERMRARAAGTVVEVVRRMGNDSAAFYPIVEFEADGRKISLESSDGGGRKRFYEGQSVEVLYDPDDPSQFMLEGFNALAIVGKVFLIIGLACIAIGVIVGVAVNATAGGFHFK